MKLKGLFKIKQKARGMIDPEFIADEELEKTVQVKGGVVLNPMVDAVKKKSGLLNRIRNRRNQNLKQAQELDAL